MAERIKAPDGTYVTFPDGTPDSVINRAMREYVQRSSPGYTKARERLRAEDKLGNRGPVDGFTRRIAGSTGASDEVGGAVRFGLQVGENLFRRATGKPIETTGGEAYLAAADSETEWNRDFAKNHPVQNAFATGLGIVASGRPTGGAAIANPFRAGGAAAIQSAPLAYARQDGTAKERLPGALGETAIAFGTGSALTAGGNYLARRAAAAKVAPPTPARILSNKGFDLTPGEMMGGAVQRAEDAATSWPILGDSIRSAKVRGLEGMNRSVIDDSLSHVGASLPKDARMGRNAMGQADKLASDAYTTALTGVSVQPGRQFSQDVQSAIFARQLPTDAADEIDAVLSNTLIPRLQGGPVTGQIWKDVDAELRSAAEAAGRAAGSKPSMRYAAETLREVRKAWQTVLESTDPQAFAKVKAADLTTAMLARVRQASEAAGTAKRGGVWGAGDLNNAVKAGAKSSGNLTSYRRGDALLQETSDAVMQTLPSTVPDSGTPFRSLMAALGTLGGVAAGGAAVGAGAVSAPATIAAGAGLLGGAMAYSAPVQRLLNAIYRAKDPGMARQALAQLAQEAGRNPALAPAYAEAARALGAPLPGNGGQPQPR